MATKNEMKVKTNDGEMKVCVMNITPKKAAEFLSMNSNNRNLREERVKVYASEMLQGNWKSNGVPIIIGDDGKLKDGQHRLSACIKSGKTMNNVVIVYLPQTQSNCYDIGLARSAADVAKFMGLSDIPYFRNVFVIASINTAIYGKSGVHRAYSKIGLVQEMQKHSDACNFIYHRIFNSQVAQTKKLCKSGIAAAIFNAYLNGYDQDKLEQFCNVFIYGICKNKTDETIINLRDKALTMKSRSWVERIQLYNVAQATLYAYENNKLTIDKKADREYYVYPDRDNILNDGQLSLL